MESRHMKVLDLYFLRDSAGKRQIPVRFNGFLNETGGRIRLSATNLLTNEVVYKPSAALFGKHSDDCWQRGTTFHGNCKCAAQLKEAEQAWEAKDSSRRLNRGMVDS